MMDYGKKEEEIRQKDKEIKEQNRERNQETRRKKNSQILKKLLKETFEEYTYAFNI